MIILNYKAIVLIFFGVDGKGVSNIASGWEGVKHRKYGYFLNQGSLGVQNSKYNAFWVDESIYFWQGTRL